MLASCICMSHGKVAGQGCAGESPLILISMQAALHAQIPGVHHASLACMHAILRASGASLKDPGCLHLASVLATGRSQAWAALVRAPSSCFLCRQRCMRRSQVCTTPSLPAHVQHMSALSAGLARGQ